MADPLSMTLDDIIKKGRQNKSRGGRGRGGGRGRLRGRGVAKGRGGARGSPRGSGRGRRGNSFLFRSERGSRDGSEFRRGRGRGTFRGGGRGRGRGFNRSANRGEASTSSQQIRGRGNSGSQGLFANENQQSWNRNATLPSRGIASRLAAKRLAGRGTGTRGRGRGLVSRLGGGAARGRRLSLTNRLAGSARLTNALALKKLQQAKRTLQLARKGRISKGGITTEALRASAARKGKLTVNALSTKKVALAVRGGRGSLAGARGAAARGKGARGALSRLPNAAVQLAILKKQLLEAKLEHAPSGRGIRGRGAVKLNRPPRAAFSSMVADQEMSSRRPSNLTISVSNPGALGKPIKLRRPNQEAEAVMAVAPVREEPVYHVQKLNTQLQREIARLQGKDGQGAGARSGLSNTASSLLSPSALAKYRPLALSSAMTMTERLSKNSRTIIT